MLISLFKSSNNHHYELWLLFIYLFSSESGSCRLGLKILVLDWMWHCYSNCLSLIISTEKSLETHSGKCGSRSLARCVWLHLILSFFFYCIHTNESESTTVDPETKNSQEFQRERFSINTSCNLQNRSEVVMASEWLL